MSDQLADQPEDRIASLLYPEVSCPERLLEEAVESAASWLVRHQKPEGYWAGRLESNACMEAEWILALWYMGLEARPLCSGLAGALRRTQHRDGSWHVFHGAPDGDINATVEAYVALRSVGDLPSSPHMVRAREWIASKGGLRNVRVFTRYWLALVGLWPWSHTPNIPPEIIFFPHRFTFSIYNFASWARASLVPVSVLSARRPVRPLPEGRIPDELFPGGRENFDFSMPEKSGGRFWDRFFHGADKALHLLQDSGKKAGIGLCRNAAVKRMLEWIVRHQEADGVWGGIQPAWIFSLMALYTEGYALDHPVMARGLAALDDPRWRVDIDGASWIQACTSPVWDTALTLLAFNDNASGYENRPVIGKALDWLLDRQILLPGDWKVKCPDLEPGGWAFEYSNRFYPDTDDTAIALIALAPHRHDPEWGGERMERAVGRGVNWLLGMQSACGGWAAFDRDNCNSMITRIPFCDFGEALDPPSVDVTAHVVEAFGVLGYGKDHPAMARALDYIRSEQDDDGAWFGRWGVNYIYGTGAVLPALKAIGEDMDSACVRKAAGWIVSKQNADGGWGESCTSYMDPDRKGTGASTPSQTAWALAGLLAAGRPGDMPSMVAGVNFLLGRQQEGTWDEPEYTGTGFPGYGAGAFIRSGKKGVHGHAGQGIELSRAFMINYNMYRHYFPLMVLGRFRDFTARLRHGDSTQ